MFTLQLASATVQPPEQRAERLAALGGRILALPHSDRASAMRQFLDVPVQVVAGTRLAEVRAAVDGGVGGLLAREADLAQPGAAAHTDLLLSGRRPSEVARQHAISGTEAIGMLETALEPRVDEALAQRGGEAPSQVAARLGIQHPGTVALLNAATQEDPVTKRRRL